MSCVVQRVLPGIVLSDDTLTYIARRYFPNAEVDNLIYVNSYQVQLVGSSLPSVNNQVYLVTSVTGTGTLTYNGAAVSNFFNGYFLAFGKLQETTGFSAMDVVYHVFQWK